jgi:hypothetical protein
MAGIESKSASKPNETRTPPKTKVEVIHLAGREAAGKR